MNLPMMIKKGTRWVSFQPYEDEVLRLTGEGLVGQAPGEVISLLDAKIELKHYLRDGYTPAN